MAAVGKIAAAVATRSASLAKGTSAVVAPRLSTFWRYAKVELRPPGLGEMPQVSQGFSNLLAGARTGRWTQLTVKEATINTLVAFEVAMWFFVGECLGKRCIVGYQIPGAVHFDPVF